MHNTDRQHDGNYSDPEEGDIQQYMGGDMPVGPQPNPRRRQRADSDENDHHGDTASAFTTLMHSLLAPALMSRPRTPNSEGQNAGDAHDSRPGSAPSPNPNRPTLPFGLFGPSGGMGPGGGGRGPRPGAIVTTRIVMSHGNGQGPPVTHVYGNGPGNEPVPDLAMYVPPAPSFFRRVFRIPSNNASAPPSEGPSDGGNESVAHRPRGGDLALLLSRRSSIPGTVGSPNSANPGSAMILSPAATPGDLPGPLSLDRALGPLSLSRLLGNRPRQGRYNTRVVIILIRAPADEDRLFTEMMTNMGGPAAASGAGGGTPGEHSDFGGNPFGASPFAAILASLLNPGAAQHGDAVYTQEALDRVITQLMEQHQSSGAAPPASAEAIAKLPKIKANEKILGPEGKAACPVCMEDVVLGEEVLELPCKHWFHEECAKSWLQEHNTCPICRKPISEDEPHEHEHLRGDPNGIPRGQSSSNNPQPGPPPPYAPSSFTFFNSGPRRSSAESRPERRDRLDSIRRAGGVTYDEDHPNIPGAFDAFNYQSPQQRRERMSPRPADGTPGGRSFADPNSGAFRDFLNAPASSSARDINRHSEEDDRHRAERQGLRLRRENSYPLSHEHHSGPAAHNPYVDSLDGTTLRGGQSHQAQRNSGDSGSWRTTRSGGSRDSQIGRAHV